jgi:hypothetical protein
MAETCTIACKLPNGLLLQLVEMVDCRENVMGGGTRTVQMARRIGPQVKINGPAWPVGGIERPPFVIAGGYALTPNVDKSFWDAWLSQNGDSDLVKNRMLLAHVKPDSAKGLAKDFKDTCSGFEPLDKDNPKSDQRWPKKMGGVGAPTTATTTE